MRVLLVVPTVAYSRYPTFTSNADFPVGLAYLASALAHGGHQVFGLNLNNNPGYACGREMLSDSFGRALAANPPDLIGLGGLCVDYRFLSESIRVVRSQCPDTPIVCGGGIATHDPEFVMKALRPDYCIVGEGEQPIVQLADSLGSGPDELSRIPNLVYWKNGQPCITRHEHGATDLDRLPFPDYEPFAVGRMLDGYSYAARTLHRYMRPQPRPMTIVTARGCPFRCTFCVPHGGSQYRVRSIASILDEIAALYQRYAFNILIIVDELFAANKSRLREFCERLREARRARDWDFSWLFQTHANANLSAADMRLAKEAGCYHFTYGIESASPRVLLSMNKKTRPAQIAHAIEVAEQEKLVFAGNLLFGDPAETAETIAETMEFIVKHCRAIEVVLTDVQPYPGSQLFDYCLETGIIKDKRRFYEEVESSRSYNMTDFPDNVWTAWLDRVKMLSRLAGWLESTAAVSCTVDTRTAENPMVLHYGMPILKIGVRCPHCHCKFDCRQPMWRIDSGSGMTWARLTLGVRWSGAARRLSGTLLRAAMSRARKARASVRRRLVSRHAIFDLLKPLEDGGFGRSPGFVTFCVGCGKAFRVRLTHTISTANSEA